MIEFGCGRGDLLAGVKPGVRVGVDSSAEMIRRARDRHPGLHFLQADVHELDVNERFAVIILSDLVNDLWEVQTVFEQAARVRPAPAPASSSVLTAAYGSCQWPWLNAWT